MKKYQLPKILDTYSIIEVIDIVIDLWKIQNPFNYFWVCNDVNPVQWKVLDIEIREKFGKKYLQFTKAHSNFENKDFCAILNRYNQVSKNTKNQERFSGNWGTTGVTLITRSKIH